MTDGPDVTVYRGLTPEQFHAQEAQTNWHRGTDHWHDSLELMSKIMVVSAAYTRLLQQISHGGRSR